YFTDHKTISEVVSYTATYVGQVQKGEKIEAAGYVEQGSDGKNRILVGTSREAAGEYIRLVG
ncbi:MAG: putative nucleotidyltransferase, partial [Gammaproteobacteria bacterium]